MINGSASHRVLWTVNDCQGVASFDLICYMSRLPRELVWAVLAVLTDANRCDGDAWLEPCGHGYKIAGVCRDGEASTGGYKVLEDDAAQPYFPVVSAAKWIDEALTGINDDGKETRIKNAVIPMSMIRRGNK